MQLFVYLGIMLASGFFAGEGDGAAWSQYGGANRDFRSAEPRVRRQGEANEWRRSLGVGTSGIVSDGKTLFTMYSVPTPKNDNSGEEVVIALDAASGKTRWEYRYSMARLNGQESYDDPRVRPQSTPAFSKGRLCTLGYSGLLKCFDAAKGKVLWQYDLVKEFGATPVQFGFSSSPLVYGEAFVVAVGGKQSALIAFRPDNGTVLWKSEAAEPSYASPVVLRVGSEDQIVQVNRDAILGVSAKNGAKRWSYPMPKPGYTNVPTPIALSEGRLLVSGQGLLATRLLQITASNDGNKVTERWKNTQVILFFCNWFADERTVYGCVGDFVGALDLATGKELWSERGQSNGNVLAIGKDVVLLRGDGLLSLCRMTPEKLEVRKSITALKGRCWTPPTVIGDMLYLRDDSEIAAVRLASLSKTK